MSEGEYVQFLGQIDLDRFSSHSKFQVSKLPTLTIEILERLFLYAKKMSLNNPQKSLALLCVAEQKALSQGDEIFLHAKAAWYIAFFANRWGQPVWSAQAIDRSRSLFEDLGEEGWLAACDWQYYAEPWVRNDFLKSHKVLESSIKILERYPDEFASWIPQARLSLAFSQFMSNLGDQAEGNITYCADYFNEMGDVLNFARAQVYLGICARRISHYAESIKILENAKKIFLDFESDFDLAHVYFQLGYSHFVESKSFDNSFENFMMGKRIYEALGMPLRVALSDHGMAQVETHRGQVRNSYKFLKSALKVFNELEIRGVQGDIYNDLGRLARLRDDYKKSIDYYYRAKELYQEVGMEKMTPYLLNNIGKSLIHLGNYQIGLSYLEKAIETATVLKNYKLISPAHLFLGELWVELQNYDQALIHLEQARVNYKKTGQSKLLIPVYQQFANVLIEQGEYEAAISYLNLASELITGEDDQAIRLKTVFLSGKAAYVSGDFDAASEFMNVALKGYKQANLLYHQSLCLLVLGEISAQKKLYDEVVSYMGQVLDLSADVFYKHAWKAHATLATLLYSQGNKKSKALDHAVCAVNMLTKVRKTFKQVSLIEDFLDNIDLYENMLALAVDENHPELANGIIEASKSMLLNENILAENMLQDTGDYIEISNLKSEINWLDETIKSSGSSQLINKQSFIDMSLQAQLKKKNKELHFLLEKLTRQNLIDEPFYEDTGLSSSYVEGELRTTFNEHISTSWIALNYFVGKQFIYLVSLSSKDSKTWKIKIDSRLRFALRLCQLGHPSQSGISKSDLMELGNHLIPNEIWNSFTEDSYILISPHGDLHNVPWPGLLSEYSKYLTEFGIPIITPSLNVMKSLWSRKKREKVPVIDKGLLIAISEFQNQHASLPQVAQEIEELVDYFDKEEALLEMSANWQSAKEKMSTLINDRTFGYMHIASHMFTDDVTGRLSGIAFADQNVWMDDLGRLNGLPEMIFFSACSGIRSRLYLGDEHMSLPSVFLQAGANQIVGSLWSIKDDSLPGFVKKFYSEYIISKEAGSALRIAQLEMIRNKIDWRDWIGFSVIGIPGVNAFTPGSQIENL